MPRSCCLFRTAFTGAELTDGPEHHSGGHAPSTWLPLISILLLNNICRITPPFPPELLKTSALATVTGVMVIYGLSGRMHSHTH